MRRWAAPAVSTLAAAVLTAFMTWPLASDPGGLGRTNTGDGLWSLWVVSWVARTLVADPLNLYNANIFYPERLTLAYSEANIGAGALGVPFYWATKNPFATHNAVVLIGFVLTCLTTRALVFHLTRSRTAAWAGAIAFAFCPFIFARTAHIQLLMTWAMPLCLLAFHRLVDRPTWPGGVLLGVLLAVQALSCAYYGIFTGLIVALGTIYFGATRRYWLQARYWLAVATAALVAVGSVLPFFLPYLEVQRTAGFARTVDDAAMYSANWQAWLTSAAWAHRWALPWLKGSSEVLFPGVLTAVLGAGGLGLAWRHRGVGPSPAGRELAGFYGLVGILALWTSFGPPAGLYALLHESIPLFSFLRAPARFGIVTTLALSIGLGLAVAWMRQQPSARWRYAAFLVPGLLVAELTTMPLRFQAAEPVNTAYRMLATMRPGPVIELPFFWHRPDFPRHAYYMLNSTYHWQPLINGYSDHIPQEFRDLVIPLSSFPTRESFRLLEQRRARYAVFHLRFYDRRSREKLMERLAQYEAYLTPLSREDDVWLYEIVAWPR